MFAMILSLSEETDNRINKITQGETMRLESEMKNKTSEKGDSVSFHGDNLNYYQMDYL